MTDFVQWYYEEKLCKSDRIDENILSIYTNKETKEVSTLLIGYPPKKISDSMSLACMGFRFKADGSVWMGTGNLNKMTGGYVHFRPNGCIDVGRFDNGILIERQSLQDFIDGYFGIYKIDEDSLLAPLFRNIPKSSLQLERESVREKYRGIEEVRVNYSYIYNRRI